MSLSYALLALLTARPLTAYDISKQFRSSVGYVWYAPDSQIYPALRQMEADGLVTATELPLHGGGGRVKRVYQVTEEGIRRFRDWINSPVPHQPERDVHHLRAAYLEWADPEQARRQMQEHARFYTEQAGQWSAVRDALVSRSHPTLVARLQQAPADQHDRIVAFRVFAYEGLIQRARCEIEWAERGLALLDQMAT